MDGKWSPCSVEYSTIEGSCIDGKGGGCVTGGIGAGGGGGVVVVGRAAMAAIIAVWLASTAAVSFAFCSMRARKASPVAIVDSG